MRKKIAIVNRTNLKNYGSVLQVYALCNIVNNMGYDSEVFWQSGNLSKNFDIRPNKIIKIGLKLLSHPSLLWDTIKTIKEVNAIVIDEDKVKLFEDFVQKNFIQSLYSANEMPAVANSDKYHKFICGSDQIWVTTTLYPDPMFYLRFAPKHKRVAYAPSLGRDYIPNYNKRVLKKYISDVPCLSVREDEGQRLIKNLTGREAVVVADPTLLIRSKVWDKLKKDIATPDKYVLCYFLDEPSLTVKDGICEYARQTNSEIVVLGKVDSLDYPLKKIHRPVAGPAEFLSLTSKADMIITDSYHGMLFAINYHKRFWSVERAYSQYDQSSRQLTVLSRLGLEDRYLKSDFHFAEAVIDYNLIQNRLDKFVEFSMNYLKDALNS